MKAIKILFVSLSLIISGSLAAQDSNPFQFISPKPASIMVSNQTNIILHHGELLDITSLKNNVLTITGSKSGIHSGELILSDDHRTVIFNPDNPFESHEDIQVVMMKGLRTREGNDVPEFSYKFSTAPTEIIQSVDFAFDESDSFLDNEAPLNQTMQGINANLPAPRIIIDSINTPSLGNIFMATWDRNIPALYGNFIFILDKNGAIIDSLRVHGAPYDFQVQSNGMLSYALGDFSSNVPLPGEGLKHMVLNKDLVVVDSFEMKNGYVTDFHEFKLLPNGHAMMMSYHTIIYDMSTVIEGGKTDASLVINIIQEQDREKNVVFEWRNIDYIPITDSDLDLTASRINYGTLNAFDVDDDGNILASFRNHSEIMKISRETGEVMWRMGGPRGEFSYVGEHEENAPYYHARQHNIRRRQNGNITLFDNGEFHNPPYSRAVEYELDEVNKVATLSSEWRYPDGNIFCMTAGNAEPLPGGGWFIGYGVPNPLFVQRNAVEVHPDGSIALELSLPKGVLAYRIYKFPWNESIYMPRFIHFEVKEGNNYSYNNDSIRTGVEIAYIDLSAADYNESQITRLPYGPEHPEFIDELIAVSPVSIIYEGFAIQSQTAEFQFDLEQYPEIKNPDVTTVYYREFPGRGLFIPRPTSYDSIENVLLVTLSGFGEIVFGVSRNDLENNIPILYEPTDQKKLLLQDSVTIRWTGKGMYNSFNVQVSADSTFSTILHESNTRHSDISVGGLTRNTKYFWRVNSILGTQSSLWSEVWSFDIADPFIHAVAPNGGEGWIIGSSEIIRWNTNLLEDVHIQLIQDPDYILPLDTVQASLQAFEWHLPEELQTGNYQILIKSASDSMVYGLSEQEFAIKDSTTDIKEIEKGSRANSLAQNYPNPFQQITQIAYSIEEPCHVTLIVYDLNGRSVQTLVSEFKERGAYQTVFDAYKFPSGIYFYKFYGGNKLMGIKKMILIKD